MDEIEQLVIDKIKVGAYEQRLDREDEGIAELAASIRRIGVIVPLVVVGEDDGFTVVAGHRRLAAAKMVGLKTVPAIRRDSNDAAVKEISFAENFFRRDLSPVELAAALKDGVEQQGLSVEELAKGFHKSEHWVRSMMAIWGWPVDVQEAVHRGKISVSAASNLAVITDEEYRVFLVRNAVEQGATARTTAAWLQAWRALEPAEEAVSAEPVGAKSPPVPLVPQAPCLACGDIFPVDRMSHVPMCGECIKIFRQGGGAVS